MRFFSLNTFTVLPVSIFASFLLASCSGGSDAEPPAPVLESTVVSSAVYGECGSGAPVELPCGFPLPRESEDNPLSMEKVELGRLMFYDRICHSTRRNPVLTAICRKRHLLMDSRCRSVRRLTCIRVMR